MTARLHSHATWLVTQDLFFIDMDEGRGQLIMTQSHCPCLTLTRAGAQAHWVTNRGRSITTTEVLRFQGVDAKMTKVLVGAGVPESRLRQMCGNAFSINVIGRVLKEVLTTSDFTPKDVHLKDPWAS